MILTLNGTLKLIVLLMLLKIKLMGQITPKPYKRLNKETGRWELITPSPVDYIDNNRMKPINIRENKYKKKEVLK